jgi:hypothetical protein
MTNKIKEDYNRDYYFLLLYLQDLVEWLNSLSIDDLVDIYFLPVRLRYFEGNFELLWGDSSFDTDHRGIWGSSTINPESSFEELKEVLKEMYNEIEDVSLCLI